MRKAIGFVIGIMLVTTSIIMIDPDPGRGIAKADATPPYSGLDHDYIWEKLGNFTNVIYDAYNFTTDIPKGRSFNSKGGNYTVQRILKEELIKLVGLENVTIEPLGHLDSHQNKDFSSFINVSDFQVTVSGCDYPYENPISKTEMGVLANTKKFGIFEEENLKIIPYNVMKLFDFGDSAEQYKITNWVNKNNNLSIVCGNLTYINQSSSIPSPDDQRDRVFLLDDLIGIQDKLNNITEGIGAIIIDSGLNITDASECSFPVIQINYLDGEELKGFLENGPVLVNNINSDTRDLTFIYNILEDPLCQEPYFVIADIPNHATLRNSSKKEAPLLKSIARILSGFQHSIPTFHPAYTVCVNLHNRILRFLPNCRGMILYDFGDYFFTVGVTEVYGYRLPIITLNNSAGRFLVDNHETARLNVYIKTEFLKESLNSPGGIGENIYGNRTIPRSPDDAVAIISNRYDGMWGQTPGDSAVGGAIVLGIAKYLKDHPSIRQKYNLTFLFTTGEEVGMLGAEYHVHKHENQNIKHWLILDQLGFDQKNTGLSIWWSNLTQEKVLNDILKESRYIETTGYPAWVRDGPGPGSEQKVVHGSSLTCDTICLFKGDRFIRKTLVGKDIFVGYSWDHWHRAGNNYTEGDSMVYIDRTDVEETARLVWDIVKYYMINPDCGFNGSVSYTAVDSPHDSDPYDDTIEASFSVVSTLPEDRVRVRAELINSDNIITLFKNFDFEATSAGTQKTIAVTLPPSSTGAQPGHYRLRLELYNSTGRIDKRYNDSHTQDGDGFYLVPRGNANAGKPSDISGPDALQVLSMGHFSTSAVDPEGDFLQYQWYWSDFNVDEVGPYPSGSICTKAKMFFAPGRREIQVRAREDFRDLFDGSYYLHRFGDWGEWSNIFVLNVRLFANFNGFCTAAASPQSAASSTPLSSVVGLNSFYEASSFGGTAPLTYAWTIDNQDHPQQERKIDYCFGTAGNRTVNLTVTDCEGHSANISAIVSAVNLSTSFNLSVPSTLYGNLDQQIVFNDTSAAHGRLQIVNWTWDFGDGSVGYGPNVTYLYGFMGTYNVTLTVADSENETYIYTKQVTVSYDHCPPDIVLVDQSAYKIGLGSNITIGALVIDNASGVGLVWANITRPDNSSVDLPLPRIFNDSYAAVFSNTWHYGLYQYTLWALDYEDNPVSLSGFSFTVEANATISVVTLKDSYTGTEFINLTDPPGEPSPSLGYELLDDGAVLHLWNQYDSYYFNTSSGIQLTNHKDQYWSRNVLMLGYYNNDQWNLLYRTDELTGFTKHIETDDATYVNITLWKDLSYGGYSFRLAIRYHLGVNDNDLTVIPYIKNIGSSSIPYVLGFGWELKDIQINMTPQGDYILVDQDKYLLNQTLDNSYTSLNDTVFYLMEDVTGSQTKSLYLRWNPDLTYKLLVKSRSGQQNAPVTLFIQVGTLAVGQQKHTLLRWYDASQETFYFNAYDENEEWEKDPELMTDESEETYASTTTDTDVQLCNANTCPGDDQGTILKVELRVHGYYEGRTPGNITLRPVFKKGELMGENYTFVASDRPEWSDWFDITSDGGHGSGQWITPWSWSEINTLDCEVEATLGSETTLFCSKVELRVTYNTAPVVSNPSPPYGVNGVGLRPWVNITVSDPDGDSMNVTWYSNSSPSLLTLRPNANGSSTELSKYPSSTQANYMCVDETVANDSDYVYWKGSSWKKDTYTLPNHTNQTGTINNITVYARCARVGSIQYPVTNSSAKIVIRINETYSYGSAFIPPYSAGPPVTYTNYAYTWTVNPVNGKNWTWTDIDNVQAGITFIGTQGTSQCSHLYVIVNYTNPNTWLQFGQNSSVSNGIYRQQFLNASVNGQWWYWKVKADDGTLSTWSSVYKFYTGYQSKIENTGETTIKGYLLMQVQYYNQTMESWIVDNDTVNETTPYIISSSSPLGLDTIFNGQVRASDLTHGTGTYRVYAAFRDPEGNILNTSDETKLEAWWLFSKT